MNTMRSHFAYTIRWEGVLCCRQDAQIYMKHRPFSNGTGNQHQNTHMDILSKGHGILPAQPVRFYGVLYLWIVRLTTYGHN